MNKLFGLVLLALAFLPGGAEAANRFLTCNTACTITAADTSIWGTVSGGTGASVPGSGDAVILDAGTCVGGTTCTATFDAGYNPTWQSLVGSLCTASTSGCILDANTNSNTITLTNAGDSFVNTGAGTRTVSGGTWILSNNGAIWNVNASMTVTNSPSIQFTGTGGNNSRRLTGGGKTYGTVTVAGGTAAFIISGANTIGTLTISGPNRIVWPEATTNTITTFTNISASVSSPVLFDAGNPTNGRATISSANNFTCDYCGMQGMLFSGGGTFAATNSYDFGNNSNIAITAPIVDGGGAHIIGSGL